MDGHAIINPAAGGGRCGRLAESALQQLEQQGVTLVPHYTQGPGDASELARTLWQQGVRQFVAVGGDGTGFEILNGLFPLQGDEAPTLGFLTLGTGNSFVRDRGIDSQETAIAALIKNQRYPCDVIRLSHTEGELYYINLLSIGFSARVASLTNRRFKPLGDAGYALAVVASLIRHEHPIHPYAMDDGAIDTRPHTLISFSNSRFTGGKMMMAPHADFSDGLMDIIRINAISRNRLLRAFPKIYQGTHVNLEVVESHHARSIRFDVKQPLDVMVDGEVLTVTPLALEVLHSVLEVIL